MRNAIVYAQELVYGLALIAFGLSPDVPLVEGLLMEYPFVGHVLSVFLVAAGAGMIVSVFRPTLLFTGWLFSAFVTGAAFIGSVGVDQPGNDVLYPITWCLFFFLAASQAYRHFGGDDGGA